MPVRPLWTAEVEQDGVEVDRRWVISFAAGIGDTNPRYYTAVGGDDHGLPAHPLLYWALSWPIVWQRTVSPSRDCIRCDRARTEHVRPSFSG